MEVGTGGVVALAAAFLVVDLAFWGASLLKIPRAAGSRSSSRRGVRDHDTWNTGRTILAERIAERSVTLEKFLAIWIVAAYRVPGTAIYLARNPETVPHALVQNVKHNGVLHERVVLLALLTAATAYCRRGPGARGAASRQRVPGVARTGSPRIRRAGVIERLHAIDSTSTPRRAPSSSDARRSRHEAAGMALWRERLFATLARNARARDEVLLPAPGSRRRPRRRDRL